MHQEPHLHKGFPKEERLYTTMNDRSYPLYRRRSVADGGHTCTNTINNREVTISNSFVIPHNLYLLLCYNKHINIEVVCLVEAVKYLYKYIHKCPDKIRVQVGGQDQEVNISGNEIER